MKGLLVYALLIFSSALNLNAQSNKIRIDSLSKEIHNSQKEIVDINTSIYKITSELELLSKVVDKQQNLIGQEQTAIQNNLNSTSLRIDVFTCIFAIIGIALSIYISRKENNINKLLTHVKELEQKTSNTKKEIIHLNKQINNNIDSLYNQLKDEETCSLFKRLVEEPFDISNICNLLLARRIKDNNFKYLILAYRKLTESNSATKNVRFITSLSYKDQYLLLFYQHFLGYAISHTITQKDIINFFPTAFQCAFEADIINSTKSLVKCLNSDKLIENKSDIMFKYIKDFNSSRHKEDINPYKIIVEGYNNEKELIDVWNNLIKDDIIIKEFGKLLCTRLSDNDTMIQSIKKIIDKDINNSANK